MRWRLKSCGVEVAAIGHSLDYTVSFLGQVNVIVISRPRSLTIRVKQFQLYYYNVMYVLT